MNVAIVTFEFEGLTRNAGIGTAYRRLAELLVSHGHRVTVLFLPVDPLRENGALLTGRIAAFRKKGISIVLPSEDKAQFQAGEIGYFLNRSNRVYQYLRKESFDIVHAADNCGLVYVSLQAKRAGREFRGTKFVIGAHGPRLWGDELNGTVTESARLMDYFDRCSVELADSLVSPSQYMLRYLRSRKWRLPKDVRVIPNANGLGDFKSLPGQPNGRAETLVFFGRFEARKGVFHFVEAVERLLRAKPGLGTPAPLRILFLGKDPDPSMRTIARMQRRLKRFRKKLHIEFLTDLTSKESLELLKSLPEAIVCMPSLVDNSPYVLVEAIEAGLNFLTTRSGGQAELLAPADRAKVLCDPSPESLYRALARRLGSPPVRVRPSIEAKSANRDWARFHARGPKRVPARPRPEPKGPLPLVSVVLDSIPALSSVLRQDYQRIEFCLSPSARWQIPKELSPRVRVTNVANGKYVLFLKAPLARSLSLKAWVRAAEASRERDPSVVVSCGITPPTYGLSLQSSSLWDQGWIRDTRRLWKPAPDDERALHRLYRELIRSGKKVCFFPEVVATGSARENRDLPNSVSL